MYLKPSTFIPCPEARIGKTSVLPVLPMTVPLQFNVSLIAPLLAQHVAFPGAQGKGLRPATGE